MNGEQRTNPDSKVSEVRETRQEVVESHDQQCPDGICHINKDMNE